LTLLIGNKAIIIYDATGTPIIIEPAAPLVGGKSAYMPTGSGKSVLVPISSPLLGEKVYIVPSSSGKQIVLSLRAESIYGGLTIFGGYDGSNNKNDIWQSIDAGVIWRQITASAEWSARRGHCVVKTPTSDLLLIGGVGAEYYNDTWISTNNGATWTRQSATAGWGARAHHSCCVLSDGSILLTGGANAFSTGLHDTWRSTDDGVTWVEQSDPSEFNLRNGHNSLLMPDGSCVVIAGGYGTPLYWSDVWRTVNSGVSWTQIKPNDSTPWSKRIYIASVIKGTKIIMAGGYFYGGLGSNVLNQVWASSDNGVTWVEQTAAAGWTRRHQHTMVLLNDGSLILSGGGDGESGTNPRNDVWRSTDDGVTWVEQTAAAGWSARKAHASILI